MNQSSIILLIGRSYITLENTETKINQLHAKLTTSHKLYVALPYTYLQNLSEKLSALGIICGSLEMNDTEKGSFTEEVAALMVKESGGQFTLVGQAGSKEENNIIANKIQHAISEGLIPFVTLGETQELNEGNRCEVIKLQIKECFNKTLAKDFKNIGIIYNSIGENIFKSTLTIEEVKAPIEHCRTLLQETFGEEAANQALVLTSMTPFVNNLKELLEKNCEGFSLHI